MNRRWAPRRWPARPFPSTANDGAGLGFARPMRNSMDAISARDFALEYLAACTIAAMQPVAAGRRVGAMVHARFRLCEPVGCFHHRLVHHAAEAQSRRRRTDPRQDRPGAGRFRGAGDRGEGPGARPMAPTCRKTRNGCSTPPTRLELSLAAMAAMIARPHGRHGEDARAPRKRAFPPPPILPTGWCGC